MDPAVLDNIAEWMGTSGWGSIDFSLFPTRTFAIHASTTIGLGLGLGLGLQDLMKFPPKSPFSGLPSTLNNIVLVLLYMYIYMYISPVFFLEYIIFPTSSPRHPSYIPLLNPIHPL